MKSGQILIVPCCEPGKGGGHLSRCILLTKDLHTLGKKARLFITPQTRDLSGLYNSLGFNPSWCITDQELEIINNKLDEDVEFIILDNYQTSYEEIIRWKKFAPVIGIDEGGEHRDMFDFLIDMLIPGNFIKPAANITSPRLLIKNLNTEYTESHGVRKDYRPFNSVFSVNSVVSSSLKILISFGQEDTAGLGLKTAQSLSAMKSSQYWDITLLRGTLSPGFAQTPINVKVLDNIPNLAEHLHEYDLVITHYGLTAYEALFADTRVLLDHPTPYHKKIAKAAGFKDFNKKNLTTNHTDLRSDIEAKVRAGTEGSGLCGSWSNNNFVELIYDFKPIVSKHCLVCGIKTEKSVARFYDRTYRRCSKCGVVYMDRINEPPIEYEKEYFFESYKKQYGKTYLEDFENIKEAGKQRLKHIKAISRRLTQREDEDLKTLLDIGCAYGPFLAAAKEEGFSPVGIDPAEDAVKYVNENLGISAIHSLFPVSNSLLSSSIPAIYDVITLWYVIEHFRDCVNVLSEIKKLLKPNGLLAFSTPSFSGISGRSSLCKFLSESPADHFTVWSPKMVKKALALYGFKVKKIVVVGHHPERFPVLGKLAKNKKGLVYSILMTISKLLGFGDTFEVFAQKMNGE